MVDTNDNTILSTSGSVSQSSDYLFVYGTLQPSFNNVFAQYLRQHGHYLGRGSFPGFLLDLGRYPGAIYRLEGDTQVLGSIYRIDLHKRQLLSYLDDYEGIGDQYAQPNEYMRMVVPIKSSNGVVDCWTYLYNLPIGNQIRIESGDYERYLKYHI